MGIKFDIEFNSAQLATLEKEILAIASGVLNNKFKEIALDISRLNSVKKFIRFLSTRQFQEDFGIDFGAAEEMKQKVQAIFQDIKIIKQDKTARVVLLNEDALVRATLWRWTNTIKAGKNNPEILVSAWDIYQNGIVGNQRSKGIPGYRKDNKIKSVVNEIISRSGLALMRKTRGTSFKFFYGAAPNGTKEIYREIVRKYGKGL